MPPEPCRALFLLQRPEAWVNFASIYEAMLMDDLFEPTVWLLPYNAGDPALSQSRQPVARDLLAAEGIAYTEWRAGMVPTSREFDVVVFGHPYDRERPAELWFDRVAAQIPVTVYVPYGLAMGGGRKNLRLQFAQPTQVRASLVVARSDMERELYAAYCPGGQDHVQVLGHPRFDRLQRELASPPPDDLVQQVAGRKAVLWNTHFSFGPEHSQSSNFSTFDLLGPEIFQFARDHKARFCLIWRPHPGLWPALLRNGLLTADDLPVLREELAVEGIVLDERPQHAPAFAVSDALITDAGSFLLEYLATNKPVRALINPEGEPLNEEAALLVAGYGSISSPDDLNAFLEGLLADAVDAPDPALVHRHLPLLDGKAGARVVRAIARLGELEELTLPERLPVVPICKAASGMAETGVTSQPHGTPTLDQLCSRLWALRDKKRAESRWHKAARRAAKGLRTSAVEWAKLHPALHHLIARARAGR
ncbi:hypothetical protein ACFWZ4_09030 [Frateuria sp. GZRe12]|uniref:hypothetical protein n=1 Tax=Frateuria sp. GZRe12 TaxID=3351533 RepID=UPI003EDC0061